MYSHFTFFFLLHSNRSSAFRNWMNSLGVDPFVHSFYDDLRDGIVLIQVCAEGGQCRKNCT